MALVPLRLAANLKCKGENGHEKKIPSSRLRCNDGKGVTGEEVTSRITRITHPVLHEPVAAMLTVRELGGVLKIDVKTIYSYVRKGLIPYVRIQLNLRFIRKEILDWIIQRSFNRILLTGEGSVDPVSVHWRDLPTVEPGIRRHAIVLEQQDFLAVGPSLGGQPSQREHSRMVRVRRVQIWIRSKR